ncbi:DUF3037 domain-containing protein [Clostridium perfringens]|uniref:DUF3037 domain-containing protein n=1 Tax=Clostridium perfringens TaxID=1502 RepID=UPI001CCDD891|nr:DUF3037 domain-containing protein [Clostridium perfringens]UBK75914.1 DUF3037 domain-containing protein [Clostridium perfringens]
MERERRKIYYSVIRYSPDDLKGEIINVGLIFFDDMFKEVRFFMLDEKSNKLKAIMNNPVELEIYKSYRDMIEYYLKKCKDDMSGVVGKISIASYYDEDFLEKIIDYYSNKELKFSKINFAFTKNVDKLFETILNRYLGKENVNFEKTNTMTAKKYMKNIFKQNINLKKRVKNDMLINPIKDLDDLKVKIDFTFKNGVWNYMQAIPKIDNNNKNTDWFSKTQLLLDSNSKDTKIHLLYRESDIVEDLSTYHLLEYLKNRYVNLEIHNIDKRASVEKLCDYIEKECEVLEEAI